MGSDWKETQLGDLISIEHGYAFKRDEFSEENQEGAIVVTIGNFNYSGGFRFESTRVKRCSSQYPMKYKLLPGEILVVMTCQTSGGEILGIPGIVPDDNETYLHNQRLGKVVLKAGNVYSKFLYWLFLSRELNHHLYITATGTKILHTAPRRIENYIFKCPSLPEQKMIAHILGSLDDKIELNQRMNETLEAMAQALFKSWFVDFDPVIDNALDAGNEIPDELLDRAEVRKALRPSPPAPLPRTQGRAGSSLPTSPEGEGSKKYGGLPDEVKRLFPSEFEFTDEMGWVPLGWKVNEIGNVVKVLGGGTPSTKNNEYWDCGDIHWTTPKDLSGLKSPVLIDTARKITSKGLAKISSGLLPEKTFLMSSRAPVGYLAIAQVPIAINQGYIAIPPSDQLSSEYLISWAHFNMDQIKGRASGTTFAEISKRNFKSISIYVPGMDIMKAFEEKTSSLYQKIVDNEKQQIILKNSRDRLLPKLLSGEIQVNKIEESLVG